MKAVALMLVLALVVAVGCDKPKTPQTSPAKAVTPAAGATK